eukprot:7684947-Alexandrium_andersonii.AAC.1
MQKRLSGLPPVPVFAPAGDMVDPLTERLRTLGQKPVRTPETLKKVVPHRLPGGRRGAGEGP